MYLTKMSIALRWEKYFKILHLLFCESTLCQNIFSSQESCLINARRRVSPESHKTHPARGSLRALSASLTDGACELAVRVEGGAEKPVKTERERERGKLKSMGRKPSWREGIKTPKLSHQGQVGWLVLAPV